MRAVRTAVLAASLLTGLIVPALAVPALASADAISCGQDLNGCASACRERVGNPYVRLTDCVMTNGGWTCSACMYNSET
ncbi:hypothetical protein KHQ06_00910 [Nocardia tengchongensis]|uniref:Uncharacterized protein n=1 Tax=Nocardia tengchongensis TaxID=2055889 RepID=A0ABX8CQC9_9NOCA|nr:hypothetical protein [Nocardia tengchongensis]QVI21779.1 hypothetical protein KHQ06_00910 [Nocardia tengchongensis]